MFLPSDPLSSSFFCWAISQGSVFAVRCWLLFRLAVLIWVLHHVFGLILGVSWVSVVMSGISLRIVLCMHRRFLVISILYLGLPWDFFGSLGSPSLWLLDVHCMSYTGF